jgi:hypothetical protein
VLPQLSQQQFPLRIDEGDTGQINVSARLLMFNNASAIGPQLLNPGTRKAPFQDKSQAL